MISISEVINKYRKQGYNVDFILNDHCLVCRGSFLEIYPDEFLVDDQYRFEGILDPSDEVVIYAISSRKRHVKGTLINVYGMYSENLTEEMGKALHGSMPLKAIKSNIAASEELPIRDSQNDLKENHAQETPMVMINLPALQEKIKQKRNWKNKDRNAITLLRNKLTRLVLVALEAKAEMKTHRAVNILSLQVLEGKLQVSSEQYSSALGEGQILALQTGIPHSIFADQESIFLLTLAVRSLNS